MSEHPISFTQEMSRAAWDGRKTMTRRVIVPQPKAESPEFYADLYAGGPEWAFWLPDRRMSEPRTWKCPYGVPGDKLWQKEPYRVVSNRSRQRLRVEYLHTGDRATVRLTDREWSLWQARKRPFAPTPGRFMYRSLARHFYINRGVRVERVQDISAEDAVAEGIADPDVDAAQANFGVLWDSINARRPGCSWHDNPWAWCISFEREVGGA